MFALPQSPMSQPWAVIAGNTISAMVGISTSHLINEPLLGMPVAVSLSILGMYALRCLRPPGSSRLLDFSSRERNALQVCIISGNA